MTKRENYIDFIRGLCILSVIFIHTVFHSGGKYTPEYLKNICLLFDVPVFFFLTGCTLAIKPNINPIKQIAKLISIFFIAGVITQVISGNASLDNTFALLTMQRATMKYMKSFQYSYWFVAVYSAALIFSTLILNYKQYLKKILLLLIPIYYLYSYFTNDITNVLILGCKLQIVLFYIWLILLGQTVYNKSYSKVYNGIYLSIFIVSALYFIHSMIYVENFSLQKCKFILSLPYALSSMISISLIMLLKNKIHNNYITHIGDKTIYFYLSQCFGGSALFYIAPHIDIHWIPKVIICFIINLLISIPLGYIFFYLDKNIHKLPTFCKKIFYICTRRTI